MKRGAFRLTELAAQATRVDASVRRSTFERPPSSIRANITANGVTSFYAAMALEDLDTEALINEVKKYPILWNSSLFVYKDHNKKMEVWMNICKTFDKDFELKSEQEKQIIGKRYAARWKNIRDNFRRNKKKIRLGWSTTGRQYIYARHLEFMNDANHDSSNQISDSEMEVTKPPPTKPTKAQPTRRSKKSTSRKRSGTKRPKGDEEMKVESTTNANVEPSPQPHYGIDEDRAFFESLVPLIKTFNIEQKLEFRTEVLNVVKRIRLGTK
ncbi:hypothetical protein Trydic_g9084 [Trypoxylus dichotomus]